MMEYTANIKWTRDTDTFNAKSFDRTHEITLGSGSQISASSAPEFLGNPALANPEELFAAAISSCFMLTFLYWASVKNIVINSYSATTTAKLAKNDQGKMAITALDIKPDISFEGSAPDTATLNELFGKAHDNCFISNSVKTTINIVQ